jgi:hypothetical protein
MSGLRNLIVAVSLVALAGCGGSAPEVNGNQEETGNQAQVNEVIPSNEAAAADGAPKADNAAAAATSDTLDRTFLVGRWSETGDCADATEFRADGSFVFPWGTGGTWQLEGDRLTLSTNTDAMRSPGSARTSWMPPSPAARSITTGAAEFPGSASERRRRQETISSRQSHRARR